MKGVCYWLLPRIAVATALGMTGAHSVCHAAIQLHIGTSMSTLAPVNNLVDQDNGIWTWSGSQSAGTPASWNIDVTVTTNSPGSPTEAHLMTVETSVKSNEFASITGVFNLYILATDSTFLYPTGSDLVLSSALQDASFTGIANTNNSATAAFTSKFDNGDGFSVELGPHSAGDPLQSDPFGNVATPFALSNLTHLRVVLGFLNTTEVTATTTGVTVLSSTVGPGSEELVAIPEPAALTVWLLLGAAIAPVALRRSHPRRRPG